MITNLLASLAIIVIVMRLRLGFVGLIFVSDIGRATTALSLFDHYELVDWILE